MSETTIDLTPTWSEALTMIKALLESGSKESKATAWSELSRMAKIADAHVSGKKSGAAEENKRIAQQALLCAGQLLAFLNINSAAGKFAQYDHDTVMRHASPMQEEFKRLSAEFNLVNTSNLVTSNDYRRPSEESES
jgi:hypothetical protein